MFKEYWEKFNKFLDKQKKLKEESYKDYIKKDIALTQKAIAELEDTKEDNNKLVRLNKVMDDYKRNGHI